MKGSSQAEITGDDPSDPLSRRVVEYIREHYAKEVSPELIARELGVTDRHIRQRFHQSMGLPPMRYLLQYRVERARELISYSDYSLKEIAAMVGFKTIHHFTRVFCAITGLSPGAWRDKYREGIRKDVYINPRFTNINWTTKGPSA
jgi:AraC-like DNA-binding protein